jgi:hypothetical protein
MPDREAPYSLRSWVGIYSDIPGLFNALQAAGCIEPAGWSADRSVTSWHIVAGFDLVKHEHDLRWNPDGMVACIVGECPYFFKPEANSEFLDSWPRYTGPEPVQ